MRVKFCTDLFLQDKQDRKRQDKQDRDGNNTYPAYPAACDPAYPVKKLLLT